MNKNILKIAVVLAALIFGSCVKDLDVTPKDPDTIMAGNLKHDPVYLKQVLG